MSEMKLDKPAYVSPWKKGFNLKEGHQFTYALGSLLPLIADKLTEVQAALDEGEAVQVVVLISGHPEHSVDAGTATFIAYDVNDPLTDIYPDYGPYFVGALSDENT